MYGFRTVMAILPRNHVESTPQSTGADVARRGVVIQPVGSIPKIVTAQRLQTWLLVAALVAIGLTALLVIDLARNLRTVVISEADRALANAVGELAKSGQSWQEQPVQPALSSS